MQVLSRLIAPLVLVSGLTLVAGVLFYPPTDVLLPRWFHLAYAGLYHPLGSASIAVIIVVSAARDSGPYPSSKSVHGRPTRTRDFSLFK